MTPDVLLVGHITRDVTDDGWRAGGSVLYAAAQCQRLGLNTAVVTVCDHEIQPETLVPGVNWQVIGDNTSTTFENREVDGRRQQRVLDQARQISIEDVPDEWQAAPIVLLMPVFHDVDHAFVGAFTCSSTILAVTVQGWLRKIDIPNVEQPNATPSARAWQGVDVVFVSKEDVPDPEAVVAWAEQIPTVVLTRGKEGTTIWSDGHRADLPIIPADEVDPTGAGDIFATAFTLRFFETQDALEAARFASAAASLAVGGKGIEAVGTRDAIEARLRREAA
jgi:sugar/nucleoside kinase (ribokinase family)